jgi:hypothetical protein
MGQQLNKIIKRRRRKAYIARKKALAKSGAIRKAAASLPKVARKVAKKAPAKKAAKPAEVSAPAAE